MSTRCDYGSNFTHHLFFKYSVFWLSVIASSLKCSQLQGKYMLRGFSYLGLQYETCGFNRSEHTTSIFLIGRTRATATSTHHNRGSGEGLRASVEHVNEPWPKFPWKGLNARSLWNTPSISCLTTGYAKSEYPWKRGPVRMSFFFS